MQTASLTQLLQQGVDTARSDAEMSAALVGVACGIRLAILNGESRRFIVVNEHTSGEWVTLSARADDWTRLLQAVSGVGWHSFTAARRHGSVMVEGDELQAAHCLHALERLFEVFRGQYDTVETSHLDLSAITGRYLSLPLQSGRCSVYLESAGDASARTLVMLHTAGADSRQFHAIMADGELRRQWHMIAFDMPGHGRSEMAPDAWLGYRLTRSRYLDVVRSVLESTSGDRKAVLLGCSMGAAMSLHAARELPDLVQGAVALEAPYRSPGRRVTTLAHAQVNQAAHNPSYVRGLMGPQSPLADRRRAAWIYSQGGFGTYAGDLAFYSDDFDAERDVAGLDGTRVPVELLTGSFDYSATPADSKRVAALIPGATFHEMPELGHFPMTEHPQAFLGYLKPALARTAAGLHAMIEN